MCVEYEPGWVVSFQHEEQPDGLGRTTRVEVDELVNELGVIDLGRCCLLVWRGSADG